MIRGNKMKRTNTQLMLSRKLEINELINNLSVLGVEQSAHIQIQSAHAKRKQSVYFQYALRLKIV